MTCRLGALSPTDSVRARDERTAPAGHVVVAGRGRQEASAEIERWTKLIGSLEGREGTDPSGDPAPERRPVRTVPACDPVRRDAAGDGEGSAHVEGRTAAVVMRRQGQDRRSRKGAGHSGAER